MNVLGKLKEHVVGMLTSPGKELGRGARFVRFQVRLWYFCARRLGENNAMAMSAALSFRTIFALVPTIVLGIVALKSFGGLDDSKQALRQLMVRSGLSELVVVERGADPQGAAASGPASRPGKTVDLAGQIEDLVARVEAKLTFGRIGPVGVALLIWSALTLLTTMERSLNRVFGARRSRGVGRRVLLYWSVMTLGPIVFVLADYVSTRAAGLFEGADALGWLLAAVGWVQPIVVGVALLAALYVFMPNTRVSVRAALGGAVVAAPAWLIAKWAFGLYVRKLVGTENLYGSLGLLPLFLLWLNLSWYLVLFGAELAHTAASLGRMTLARPDEPIVLTSWDLLAAAAAVAGRHLAGLAPTTPEDVAERLNVSPEAAHVLLDRLAAGRCVCGVDSADADAYVPARAPRTVRVTDVMELGGASEDAAPASRMEAGLAEAVGRVRRATREALAEMTLAELIEGK